MEAAIHHRIYAHTLLLRNVLQARVPTPLVSIDIPPNALATYQQMA